MGPLGRVLLNPVLTHNLLHMPELHFSSQTRSIKRCFTPLYSLLALILFFFALLSFPILLHLGCDPLTSGAEGLCVCTDSSESRLSHLFLD